MWKVIGPIVVFILLVVFVILFLPENSVISNGNMVLNSTAFTNGGKIPVNYTCDGQNTNPPLSISGVPNSAKSLVLVMYDENAPEKEFTHWIVFNMKPSVTEVQINNQEGKLGFNDWNNKEYGGPCPPQNSSAHNYVFTLYAVNTVPIFSPRIALTRKVLEDKISKRIVEETTLKGTYARV